MSTIKIIQEQLQKKFIEPVKENKSENPDSSWLDSEGKSIHYIPHHAVIHQEMATTKFCIMYNGSAKIANSEPSINECLQTGSNLIPKLFDVLVCFRSHRIAVTADIEKTFLMISIIPTNHDVLRFLWFQGPTKLDSPILHFCFIHVLFDLRPSPAILASGGCDTSALGQIQLWAP